MKEVVTEKAIETLEQAMVKVIDKSLNGLDTATEFIISETPEVIQQLLLWHGVSNFIYFCIGICLLTGIGLVCRWSFKRKDKWTGRCSEVDFMCYLIVPVVCCVVLTICCLETLNLIWLKVWLAPKLYLIEYLKELVSLGSS